MTSEQALKVVKILRDVSNGISSMVALTATLVWPYLLWKYRRDLWLWNKDHRLILKWVLPGVQRSIEFLDMISRVQKVFPNFEKDFNKAKRSTPETQIISISPGLKNWIINELTEWLWNIWTFKGVGTPVTVKWYAAVINNWMAGQLN